jgi:hypothetical protein
VNAVLAQVVAWLNAAASAIGGVVLYPIGLLPGWISATVVAAVTGVLLLVVFKYTSNQRAIKRVRDDISANLLALKLFKDSTSVALRAQGRMLADAFWLLIYAIVPMLVMVVPVTLVLAQLALWYQARPLRIGEDAVVTARLDPAVRARPTDVRLKPTRAVEVLVGPVRVRSKHEVCWKIQARENGRHQLDVEVDGQSHSKDLAIGDGFMPVSLERPGWSWSEMVLHPAERPFRPGSLLQSITIVYPERSSWTSGTDSWVIYWFGASFVAAILFRRALNVNV